MKKEKTNGIQRQSNVRIFYSKKYMIYESTQSTNYDSQFIHIYEYQQQ